jgi:hypothetical protein
MRAISASVIMRVRLERDMPKRAATSFVVSRSAFD